MEMTPEKWEKVKVLFDAALAKPSEQRLHYLQETCAEEDLRAEVVRLLAEFEDAGVDLLLLQFSPQLEEMERFAAQVIGNEAASSQLPASSHEAAVRAAS